jgi:hypothetical protein
VTREVVGVFVRFSLPLHPIRFTLLLLFCDKAPTIYRPYSYFPQNGTRWWVVGSIKKRTVAVTFAAISLFS